MNQLLFRWLLIVGFFTAFSNTSNAYNKIYFHNNLNEAKNKAAREGKLYMVDFMAKWCMPCKWMDETTFADERVVNYLKENYVAVKIDIDNFDGFAHKQLYGIKVLPSILIFNSKGELLEQYTGSHAPSGLLEILEEHNTPNNRISAKKKETTTVEQPSQKYKLEKPTPTKQPKKIIKRNKLGEQSSNPERIAKPKEITSRPSLKPQNTQTTTAPEVVNEGLFRFTVSRYAQKGYSVQTGVYADYGNVLREVEKLQSKFGEDLTVLVHISRLNQKKVFKVLVGHFRTYKGANKFKQTAELQGIPGMIKDLQVLK